MEAVALPSGYPRVISAERDVEGKLTWEGQSRMEQAHVLNSAGAGLGVQRTTLSDELDDVFEVFLNHGSAVAPTWSLGFDEVVRFWLRDQTCPDRYLTQADPTDKVVTIQFTVHPLMKKFGGAHAVLLLKLL
jgi:hypothetical protein